MLATKSKTIKKKAKPKQTPEQKAEARVKREHERFGRDVFLQTGFKRLVSAIGKEFKFEGVTSEFDDVFLNENVLVLVEYTTSKESNVSAHLKNKCFVYQRIIEDQEKFVNFFRMNFSDTNSDFNKSYLAQHFRVRIVYASRWDIKSETKNLVPYVKYLDYNYLRYFANVVGTVKLSARYELLEFLDIKSAEYAEAVLSPNSGMGGYYEGSVLPEAQSHFPKDFKVVSFYVAAETLLSRAYVLRRDGWRSNTSVYQRMISRRKIEAIRKHLLEKRGVFVNNIVVTLPPDTKLLDKNGNTIDVSTIKNTTPGRVSLPIRFNSVGLVDGQHRVFSYYEGGQREEDIAILRKQQNLLVTGIMFPEMMTDTEKTSFEAKLFLDINSNQMTANSELKQEIGMLLNPFSVESIAKRIINSLNEKNGPLNNVFEKYFFDKDKLKTTTIVSYGLRPLVRPGVDESLYQKWSDSDKDGILEETDYAALERYITYCVTELNTFIGAARSQIDKDRWTTEKKVPNRVLNTTFVNGLIFCFRRIVKADKLGDFDYYATAMKTLNSFDFSAYRSSQYNKMSEVLYNSYFA